MKLSALTALFVALAGLNANAGLVTDLLKDLSGSEVITTPFDLNDDLFVTDTGDGFSGVMEFDKIAGVRPDDFQLTGTFTLVRTSPGVYDATFLLYEDAGPSTPASVSSFGVTPVGTFSDGDLFAELTGTLTLNEQGGYRILPVGQDLQLVGGNAFAEFGSIAASIEAFTFSDDGNGSAVLVMHAPEPGSLALLGLGGLLIARRRR